LGFVCDDNQRAVTHIDGAWNLEKLIGRWNVVESVRWSSTDAIGADLIVIPIPTGVLTTAAASAPFTNFQLSRFKVTLKIQSNSTAFYDGMLIGYVIPILGRPTIPDRYKHKTVQTSLNHVFIEAKESTTVEIEIPFIFMQDYYNIQFIGDEPLSIAHFALSVFTPLKSVTASTPHVDITIYSKVEVPEFHVPAVIAPPTITRRFVKSSRPEHKVNTDEYNIISRRTKSVKSQGLMSMAEGVFNRIIDRIKPEEIVADAIGSLGSMDKPNFSVSANPVVNRFEQYLPHAQNVENIPRLALYPGKLNLSDQEHFGTTQDEMNIKNLTSKVTWYKSAIWNTTDVKGKILFQDFVGPVVGGIPEITGTNGIPVTTLDYVSIPFSRWRGGIKYKIIVVCSGFHGGRLMFSFHPNVTPTDDTILNASIESRSSQYYAVLDLKSGRNSFEVVCPFLSPTSWKTVYNGGPTDTIYDYTTGKFYISVLNPLIAPNNVSPEVSVEVFVGGADDYQLALLNHNNVTLTNLWNTTTFRSQGLTSGAKDLEKETKKSSTSTAVDNDAKKDIKRNDDVVLCAGEGKTRDPQTRYPHFSEVHESLGDIFKRYSPSAYWTKKEVSSTPAEFRAIYAGTQPLVLTLSIADLLKSYYNNDSPFYSKAGRLTYFLNMFRMWRGSLRFKIIPTIFATTTVGTTKTNVNLALDHTECTFIQSYRTEIPNVSMTQNSFTPIFAGTTGNGTAVAGSGPYARFDGQSVCEFEIPYTHFNATTLTRYEDDWTSEGYDDAGSIVFAIYCDGVVADNVTQVDFSVGLNIAVATGDDFRCGTWFGTPIIYPRYAAGDVPVAFDEWKKA
jgi:hypothetical protein